MEAQLPLTSEQEELRGIIRQFLQKKSPISAVRTASVSPTGYDAGLWSQLSNQLALQALAIPEEYGGAGFGYQELGIAFEETGRALFGGPLFSTAALAAPALSATDDEAAKKELLPPLAAGEATATLAFTEATGAAETGEFVGTCATTATHTAGGWVLDGHKTLVVDGHTADLILVTARTDSDRLSLFAVQGHHDGVTRSRIPTLDETRAMAEVTFAKASARLIGRAGDADAALRKANLLALVALSAEQAGGAAACLDMSVSYAKTRHQFGRAIGSFQAIKHILAEMFVDVQSAQAAAQHAAYAAAGDLDELPRVARVAKTFGSESFYRTAAANVQMHGGIGFTWEHDSQLFYKRATASRLFLGSPQHHRETIAQLLEI